MVAHTLATVSDVRNWLATTSYSSSWTGDAATLLRLLEQSTREIEAYCGNAGKFGPVTQTVDFDEGNGTLLDDPRLVNWDGTRPSRGPLPWVISISSMTLYTGTDRTSSTALVQGTDYLLTPYISPTFRRPYTGMKWKDSGDTDPWGETGQKVLAIAGEWGWYDDTFSTTTLDGAITDAAATSFDVASAALISAGHTLLVGTERIYVESVSSNTLTVERGVAGSTAATHLTGATVSRYSYPAAVKQACLDLTRLGWVDRTGGLVDEVSIAGAEYSRPQHEKRAILSDIDSFATHSQNQGITF